ncbi:hypothetical protein JCM9279_007348 [Rhodotorula babjevae]
MSTSGVSRSWTPGTERRYATTTAPSSTGRRLTRGMKAVLLLALLAVLIVAIVPAAVVSTRKDDKQYRAEDRALGYTTVVDGLTTFVQTRTASIVTRSSYRTLDNGDVSTVLQAVTLPIITVSATSAGEVQQGFETVTVNGQEVIVATVTRFVAGANAFVTRTVEPAELGVATVYRTVFDDLTVVQFVFLRRDDPELQQPDDAHPDHDPLDLDHRRSGLLFLQLAACDDRPARSFHLCSISIFVFHLQRPTDDLVERFVPSSAAVEREQLELSRFVDLEQLVGASSAEQQHSAAFAVEQHDAARRALDPQHVVPDVGVEQLCYGVALQLDAGFVLEQDIQRSSLAVDERIGQLPLVHNVAFSSTLLVRDGLYRDESTLLERFILVNPDVRPADDDHGALHSGPAALPRRLRARGDYDYATIADDVSLEQQHGRPAADDDLAGMHPRAARLPRRVRPRRVDHLLAYDHLDVLVVIKLVNVVLLAVDNVVFPSSAADDHDRGVHPGLADLPRRLRRVHYHDHVAHKHERLVEHERADVEFFRHGLCDAHVYPESAADRRRLRPVRPAVNDGVGDSIEHLHCDYLGRHVPAHRLADLVVFLVVFQRDVPDNRERHLDDHDLVLRHHDVQFNIFVD